MDNTLQGAMVRSGVETLPDQNRNQMFLSSPLVPSGTRERRLMQNTRPKACVCGSGVAPTESIDQYGVRFSCYGGKKIGSNKTGPHNGCFSGVSLSSPFLCIFGFSRISRSSVPYFARSPHSDNSERTTSKCQCKCSS